MVLACGKTAHPGHRTNALADTKTFFTQEVARLAQLKYGLHKTVMINTEVEEREIPAQVNWPKELGLFMAIDLTRSGVSGDYRCDSVNLANGYSLTYTTTAPKQHLKKVTLWYTSTHQVTAAEFTYRKETEIYDANKQLRYVVDSGYCIQSTQHTLMGKPITHHITGKFIPSR